MNINTMRFYSDFITITGPTNYQPHKTVSPGYHDHVSVGGHVRDLRLVEIDLVVIVSNGEN